MVLPGTAKRCFVPIDPQHRGLNLIRVEYI